MQKKNALVALAVAAGCLLSGAQSLSAAAAKKPAANPKLYRETVDRGIRFLASRQADDGSWSAQAGIGPTAIATFGLLRNGRTAADPQVAKGLAYIEKSVQESGGIHKPGTFITNYETCIALLCFKEANGDGRYDKAIKNAEAFLRGVQIGEKQGKEKSDVVYGGAGYGAKSRPDLSNTAFLLDALKACGAGADDEAMQKALVFVSRCQNLESEHNNTKYAAKINDGGFYYTPAEERPGGRGGEARTTPDGGLRSYGTMTYAGLKSMIYAGLSKDDPRVKAATQWIRKHYDLKSNPGMGDAGLFYFYHTFAKTLDVLGIDEFEDAQGVKHDWRRELTEELARRQLPDGSWVNKDTTWLEGDANLATAYAVLALSYCRPKEAK